MVSDNALLFVLNCKMGNDEQFINGLDSNSNILEKFIRLVENSIKCSPLLNLVVTSTSRS